MIELNHITKKYGSREVLKNISITLPDTGLVSILGKSGSGKSTLLNIIGLLDKPTSGEVIIDGRNTKEFKKKNIDYYHFKHVGFVFQQFNLFNDLTVKDNIQLVSKFNTLDFILKDLDILDLKNTKVAKLSGGEKQRVAIARSIINNPKILLCDEPTGALDSKTSIQVMDLLKKLSERMLVVVVTHNYDLAKKYSDEIIEIKDGIVHQDKNNYKLSEYLNFKKVKLSYKKMISIIKNNIKRKKKRNILTILALFIGFFSLSLVLGLSDGFVESIEYENKNSMSKFPIYISEVSTNIKDDLNSLFDKNNNKDKIYPMEFNHINKYDMDYVNNLEVLNNNLEYKLFSYNYDNVVLISSKLNDVFDNFEFILGSKITSDNDVILLLNDDNTFDSYALMGIGLENRAYEYNELLNYQFNLRENTYKICGIAKVKDGVENTFASGLYVNFDTNIVPDLISLYPKDYENKRVVLDYLNKFKDIYYTDYANSITDISKTLVNSIKIILVCFSLLSLIVSVIMIGILCYVSILERIRDIGIYKSLGISNRKVKLIFILENVFISLTASILTIILICLISNSLNNILFNIIGISNIFRLGINNMLFLILLSIFIGLISTYLPVKKITKYNIVDSLNI